MNIEFTKMHGLGNDFVVIDNTTLNLSFTPDQIQSLSNRHTGIGFDQLLLLEPTQNPNADFFYRIYNADGTQAEQCGNGARCVARFAKDKGLIQSDTIRFETVNDLIEATLLSNELVRVTMNKPQDVSSHHTNATLVNIGNPHCIIQTDHFDKDTLKTMAINITKDFPDGINVGFFKLIDKNTLELLVYERGTGFTQACGSGACAAVVAGRFLQLLNEKVSVIQPGGELIVEFKDTESPLHLTGPATTVFEGRFNL